MKKKRKTVLILALAAVFAVSAGMLTYELYQYQRGEETYAEAEELAGLPDFSQPETVLPDASAETSVAASQEAVPYVDPYAQQLQNMDFSALREVNREIIGWILIPNTVVSYPLLSGSDSSYYLTHTWKKETSIVGAIFLESQNHSDLSDFNTVIYGHNMNNGSMFGSLKKYKSADYWKKHPTVYLTDDAGSHAYEIFAAYEASTDGMTYQIGFSSDSSRQAFLDHCVGQSVISTGVTPTVYDRILTLSTCTGHGHSTRWVVQARLKGTVPQAGSQTAAPETESPQSQAESPAPEGSMPEESEPIQSLPENSQPADQDGEKTEPDTQTANTPEQSSGQTES